MKPTFRLLTNLSYRDSPTGAQTKAHVLALVGQSRRPVKKTSRYMVVEPQDQNHQRPTPTFQRSRSTANVARTPRKRRRDKPRKIVCEAAEHRGNEFASLLYPSGE